MRIDSYGIRCFVYKKSILKRAFELIYFFLQQVCNTNNVENYGVLERTYVSNRMKREKRNQNHRHEVFSCFLITRKWHSINATLLID